MNREGWICPRCQQANAPWMPTCSCNPGTGIGVTKPLTLPWVKLPGATNNDDMPGYVKPTTTDGEDGKGQA